MEGGRQEIVFLQVIGDVRFAKKTPLKPQKKDTRIQNIGIFKGLLMNYCFAVRTGVWRTGQIDS